MVYKNIAAFVKIEPLYIKEKFAKTEITKRFQLQRSISNAYYTGEVNNLNKPHGIGLNISPYNYYIEEGHYKNGKRHGKFKIVIEWTPFYPNHGKIILVDFLEGHYCGYFRYFTENGAFDKKGYEKQRAKAAE